MYLKLEIRSLDFEIHIGHRYYRISQKMMSRLFVYLLSFVSKNSTTTFMRLFSLLNSLVGIEYFYTILERLEDIDPGDSLTSKVATI